MTQALTGIRVVDLTNNQAGPSCGQILAWLGADVVKVEEPGRRDYIRWIPPMVDGESASHRALNRGKRSTTLNLKSPEGVEILKRLAATAPHRSAPLLPDRDWRDVATLCAGGSR